MTFSWSLVSMCALILLGIGALAGSDDVPSVSVASKSSVQRLDQLPHLVVRSNAAAAQLASDYLLLIHAAFLTSLAALAAPTLCNGHAEYCSRPYSNLTQIGSHDSAFVGRLPTQNQHLSVADQLARGVRFLQAQTHRGRDGETLELCHTTCFAEDAGPLADYLSTVRKFLDAHAYEVVTLLLVNGDNVAASAFDAALQAADAKQYAFAPSSAVAHADWPTVGTMLGKNQRLVVFLDQGADPAFPALLDEFTYFFETPYSVTSMDDFAKCEIDRPPSSSPDGKMYIVNHFLDRSLPIGGIKVPDVWAAGTTNSPDSIQAQASVCEGLYGRNPRAVLLDYMDQGDGLAWGKQANGLS